MATTAIAGRAEEHRVPVFSDRDPTISFRKAVNTQNLIEANSHIDAMLTHYANRNPEIMRKHFGMVKMQIEMNCSKDPRWQEIQNKLEAATEHARREKH